jgi:hypothetical protein
MKSDLGIYAGLNVIEIVFAILIYLLNVYHGIESSRKLHDDFIRKVVRAPTGFFDFTPMGRCVVSCSFIDGLTFL